MSSVDVVNPSLIHRPQVVWCIQQFDSRLTDVALYLLSRLTTKKKVDHNANVNAGVNETYVVVLFTKKKHTKNKSVLQPSGLCLGLPR